MNLFIAFLNALGASLVCSGLVSVWTYLLFLTPSPYYSLWSAASAAVRAALTRVFVAFPLAASATYLVGLYQADIAGATGIKVASPTALLGLFSFLWTSASVGVAGYDILMGLWVERERPRQRGAATIPKSVLHPAGIAVAKKDP